MNFAALLAALGTMTATAFGFVGDPFASEESVLSDRLLASLKGLDPLGELDVIVETRGPSAEWTDRATALGLDLIWTYEIIPAFAARGSVAEIQGLADEEWVTGVWDSRPVHSLMDVSAGAIQAPEAWTAGSTGAGVTVAVIDSGIEITDPDLAPALVECVATLAGLTLPDCSDTNGHGTHVAGTVASRDTKYRGIAPGASLAAVRVLHAGGAGTSADIIAGMDWVGENKDTVVPPIRVATMSIGFVDPGCGDGRDPEAKAADALVARGVTFTIAAGNSGHDDCTVDGASAAFNVITVGASDDRGSVDSADDTLAGFSSAGPTKDGRMKPELVAPGVGISSVYLGPTIAELDGTSMATPHVAGAAALLLESEPGLSPAAVKARLTGTTEAPSAAGDLPNEDWGQGLVNVCRALQLAACSGGAAPTTTVPVPTSTTPTPTATTEPSPTSPAAAANHVQSVVLTYKHQSAESHIVATYVYVVDAQGDRMPGVTVSLDVTSPEGDVYPRQATTDERGRARMQATQEGGGHGSWESCVTGLSGTYDSAANGETCDQIAVA